MSDQLAPPTLPIQQGTLQVLAEEPLPIYVPAGPALPPRYADLGLLGAGGMGEVRRVMDKHLGRSVAMKILHPGGGSSGETLRRFALEARLTARLQHPGIVAVHDFGELADGRLWFTMREVHGRTLSALLAELHAASPEAWAPSPSGWTLRRLLSAFHAACLAVAYAHHEGVTHRDLKPDNIMVGAFGEVQVMDWGIAQFESEERPGTLLGTPVWMAPEQASGAVTEHGPRTDVYALGAMLFALLSGQAPYGGSGAEVIRRILRGPAPRLQDRSRPRHPPLPAPLVALVEQAMSPDPQARPPEAGAFAEPLQAWLDGELRHENALRIVGSVAPLEEDVRTIRAQATKLEHEAAALLSPIPAWAPVEEKKPAWDLETKAAQARVEAELLETRYLQGLQAALEQYPELPQALSRLADHWKLRLEEAEARKDPEGIARSGFLTRQYDRGRHTDWLEGKGSLSLQTDPPGAMVFCERYEEQDRRLIPVELGPLGQSPLRDVPLVAGSYRLRISLPGRPTVLLPIRLKRGEPWDGRPPGHEDALYIPIPEEVPAGMVYIPPGWVNLGGDPEAIDGLSAHRLWIEGFFIGLHPVTAGDWLAFLQGLLSAGRGEEVSALLPGGEAGVGQGLIQRFSIVGDQALLQGLEGTDPSRLHRLPLMGITWQQALVYARAQGARLPMDSEWEKAARGVDGRFFPWGDRLDPTFTVMGLSQAGSPQPRPVDELPLDKSPYGVMGLGGNIRELCLNEYERQGPLSGSLLQPLAAPPLAPYRMVRGGAWGSSTSQCRAASRFVMRPDQHSPYVGFRLARSLGPDSDQAGSGSQNIETREG